MTNQDTFSLGDSVDLLPEISPNYEIDMQSLITFLKREYGLELQELNQVNEFLRDEEMKIFWERAAEMIAFDGGFDEIKKMNLDELVTKVSEQVANRDIELARNLEIMRQDPDYLNFIKNLGD